MKNRTHKLLIVALCLIYNIGISASEPAYSVGTSRTIKSTVLDKEMSISIHLPQSYSTSGEAYPAIFMLGSDYKIRFGLMASTLDYLAGQGQIPEFILIGIDLPEGNRVLLPERNTGDLKSTHNHIEFLQRELIPFAEENYRLEDYRILYGGSNSGWFTVYTLLHQPDLFHAYFASSPSLGVTEQLLRDKVSTLKDHNSETSRHLFTIYSDDERDDTQSIPTFTNMLEKSKPSWLSVAGTVRANEGHVPATDINFAFHSLFPDYNPLQELVTLQDMRQHFQLLSERYGFQLKVPASMLFSTGSNSIVARDFENAKEIFEFTIESYPKWSRGYVGLGVVFHNQDQLEEARELFNKAIEVNPEDRQATWWVNRLDESNAP